MLDALNLFAVPSLILTPLLLGLHYKGDRKQVLCTQKTLRIWPFFANLSILQFIGSIHRPNSLPKPCAFTKYRIHSGLPSIPSLQPRHTRLLNTIPKGYWLSYISADRFIDISTQHMQWTSS